MGLLDSLFGSKSKPDYGALYPDPPQYSLAPGSLNQYQGQIQSLIDLFGGRANGTDQFDYMTYLYGPQESEVNRQYGINRPAGDQTVGALQRTQSSLNQRGLLDSGTSGVVEAQLEADRIRQLAQLFGESKQLQRGDIDNSLNALGQLYPVQFETAQIQPNIDYSNSMSRFNQDYLRNSAQQSYEASKPASPWASLLGQAGGTAIGSLFGQPMLGASIGNSLFGGGSSQSYQPTQSYQSQPSYSNSSNMFSNNGGNYLATKYPSLFGAPGF